MNCPVCYKKITDRKTDYMEHVLTEEHLSCRDEYHHFYSMYAYGSTEETVGSVSIRSHYNDTKEQKALANKQFQEVVALERESYIKKMKTGGIYNE